MNKGLEKIRMPACIAFIQWLFMLLIDTDSIFFRGIRGDAGQSVETGIGYLCGTEALALVALILMWSVGFEAFRKVREGDKFYRRCVEIFKVYFTVQIFLLVILWPGTWAWDDIMALQYREQFYEMFAWQHVITSIWQITLLHILPFPGGIVLLQQLVIAICVSLSLSVMERDLGLDRLKNKRIDLVIKLLPFLMPPVLLYQYSGYRIGILVYFELVCIIFLAKALMKGISKRECYILSALIAIVAEWRSENIIYAVVWLLALAILNKRGVKARNCIYAALICIGTFISVHALQNASMENPYVYSISSTMRPAVALLHKADSEKDQNELKALYRIINKEFVEAHPEANGEIVFGMSQLALQDLSHEEYQAYMNAVVKLALKYPGTVLNERFSVFVNAMGVNGAVLQVTNVLHAAHLMDINYPNDQLNFLRNSGWILVKPRFPVARRDFVLTLGQQDSIGKAKLLYYILWNSFIPVFILLGFFVSTLVKRQWFQCVVLGTIVIKLGIVILAEPSPWIMYFLTQYMAGYILLVYAFIMLLRRKEKKGA
jgi:hypothetical protein